MSGEHTADLGARFQFGANWTRFLAALDEQRIVDAEASLREMLKVDDLKGQRFLDIGSGSGLFSLAARRLGATVHSFDFDPESVACTEELKRRFFPGDANWRIEQGSALDGNYVGALGQFDVVYSWGVLHHTGAMWLAIENAIRAVRADDGKLYIAIYNDQGWKSHLWWFVKLLYNRLPRSLRSAYVFLVSGFTRLMVLLKYTFRLQPMTAIRAIARERRERGMSTKYDKVDWIGGFPYEFAAFETLVAYFASRGFAMLNSRRNTSLGCNELVLQRTRCAD